MTRKPTFRLWQHIYYAARQNLPVSVWIRDVLASGAEPEMLVVQQASDPRTAERQWIERLRNVGCDLTNVRKGGARGPASSGWKHTPETRERMRQAQLGKRLSDETRERIGAAQVGRKASPETRARMSAAHMGHKRPKSDEQRAKLSAALSGRTLSPEHRAAIGAGLAARERPTREPRVYKRSAEWRESIAEGQRRAWAARKAG